MKLNGTDQSTTLEMSPEEWAAFKRAMQFSVNILAGKFKEVKDMKDDERSVTWAPRRIRQLEQFVGLDPEEEKMPMPLLEMIHEHHSQLRRERARIDELEDKAVPSSRISELARRMTSESKRINELRTQISALESKFDNHLQWAAQHDHPDDMAERIGGVARRVEALERGLSEYGVPFQEPGFTPRFDRHAIGPQVVGEFEDKIPQVGEPWANDEAQMSPSTEYPEEKGKLEIGIERGWQLGYAAAMDEMKSRQAELVDQVAARVEKYMEPAFQSSTIAGVLRALRDEN